MREAMANMQAIRSSETYTLFGQQLPWIYFLPTAGTIDSNNDSYLGHFVPIFTLKACKGE